MVNCVVKSIVVLLLLCSTLDYGFGVEQNEGSKILVSFLKFSNITLISENICNGLMLSPNIVIIENDCLENDIAEITRQNNSSLTFNSSYFNKQLKDTGKIFMFFTESNFEDDLICSIFEECVLNSICVVMKRNDNNLEMDINKFQFKIEDDPNCQQICAQEKRSRLQKRDMFAKYAVRNARGGIGPNSEIHLLNITMPVQEFEEHFQDNDHDIHSNKIPLPLQRNFQNSDLSIVLLPHKINNVSIISSEEMPTNDDHVEEPLNVSTRMKIATLPLFFIQKSSNNSGIIIDFANRLPKMIKTVLRYGF